MASAAQIQANLANAQSSTGPRTAAGKSNSSRNSLSHGLSAESETLFSQRPALREEYESHVAKLRLDLPPETEVEEQLFSRWAFSSFQAERARRYEVAAELDMADHFGDHDLERRWMRFTQTRIRLSREADLAFQSYFKHRDDRLAVLAEARAMESLTAANRNFESSPQLFDPMELLARFRAHREQKRAAAQNEPKSPGGLSSRTSR